MNSKSRQKVLLTNYQQGFAHIIPLVVVVVSVISVVGFTVFRHNSTDQARSTISQNHDKTATGLNNNDQLASGAQTVPTGTPNSQSTTPGSSPATAPNQTTATTNKPKATPSPAPTPTPTSTPSPSPAPTPKPSPTQVTPPPTDPCAVNKTVYPNSTVITMYDQPWESDKGSQRVKDIYGNQSFLAQDNSCAYTNQYGSKWVKASSDGASGYVNLIWISQTKVY